MFVDAAVALDIEPQRRVLWQHLHTNLAPLPLVNVSDNGAPLTIFGGVLGNNNHPESYGNPLNVYLGWPGYDDALTTVRPR